MYCYIGLTVLKNTMTGQEMDIKSEIKVPKKPLYQPIFHGI